MSMGKRAAKEMVHNEDLTWGDIRKIMVDARNSGMDFTQRSVVNSSFTKGISFNILWKGFPGYPEDRKVSGNKTAFVAVKILREFGNNTKKYGSNKRDLPSPHHEDPIDITLDGETK